MSLTLHLHHQSSLSQFYQVESCYPCSREVTPCRPPVVIPIWFIHPQVISCSYVMILTLSMLFCVDWWGINQCPPLMDLFLLTTTHYLGIWSRNPLVPWILQSSVASLLTFDSGIIPLVPVQMTLRVFDCSTSIHTP